MNIRNNISSYFENILDSIKNMEEGAEAFTELEQLAIEISQLEQYVKISFETLDNHFQAYVNQINLLSSLIDFQRKVIQFKTPEEVSGGVFDYLKEHINFDRACIYLKVSDDHPDGDILADDPEQIEAFRALLRKDNNLEKFNSIVYDKDLGMLLNKPGQLESLQIPWQELNAHSVLMFPLRMQGELIGFGLLVAYTEKLSLDQLSFLNLNLGILSLLLFQHFYFFQLKRRLFKQVKLQKVLEDVKYAEYFDKGPLFIYSLDDSGIILHANASALQSIQAQQENVIGRKFLSFIPPEHRQPFENILRTLQIGDLNFYKTPVLSGQTADRIWDCYITKMELHERFHLNIIFAVDVTRQYYQEQLQTRNEILNQVTQFSRVINGYLSNLLTVMIPNVSLIKTQLDHDDELQKPLHTMELSLRQTESLVQKFLNYDLKELEQPAEANLNRLVKEILDAYEAKTAERINFKFSLDPGIPKMVLYPKRLARLLRILIQNCLEALPERGTVKISTRIVKMNNDDLLPPHMFYLRKGRYVEMSIEDNGVGIEPKLMKHIFKPFFSTKIKNESLGLGLFVAYNIVKDLKGEIFVRSQPNKSTTFYVYLPLKGEKPMQVALPGKVEPSVQSKAPFILVVDD